MPSASLLQQSKHSKWLNMSYTNESTCSLCRNEEYTTTVYTIHQSQKKQRNIDNSFFPETKTAEFAEPLHCPTYEDTELH